MYLESKIMLKTEIDKMQSEVDVSKMRIWKGFSESEEEVKKAKLWTEKMEKDIAKLRKEYESRKKLVIEIEELMRSANSEEDSDPEEKKFLARDDERSKKMTQESWNSSEKENNKGPTSILASDIYKEVILEEPEGRSQTASKFKTPDAHIEYEWSSSKKCDCKECTPHKHKESPFVGVDNSETQHLYDKIKSLEQEINTLKSQPGGSASS